MKSENLKITVLSSTIFITCFLTCLPSFGQQTNLQNHPLTSVTSPIPVGNGNVFQTVMIFNTKPVQDVGLAEYNKAVNFEKAKSMIVNATFTDKMLKDIISDVENQRTQLQTEGKNVTKYYTNGSMTLQYSKWWMQSYVTSRLDEDGLQTILSGMNPGTPLQAAIDPVDKEMKRIISNYNLNYSQTQLTHAVDNKTNSANSNLNKTTSVPAFGQEIELANIHTSISNIHVGDLIKINATIINNSPDMISFNSGCMSPLAATFDNNVGISQAMGCFAIYVQNLKPGENTTVVGPSNSISYIANSTGTTNANVTFSYTVENKSQNTISKSFTFVILEKATIPEFPSIALVIFTISILASVVFVSQKNNLFKL
jgi:hypothetical protein